MKRLRDNDDDGRGNHDSNSMDTYPWLPAECDIGSPPRDPTQCRDEWFHFLALLQQWAFIVPPLGRYTIDVWAERPYRCGNDTTNGWLPVEIHVITKIHSLHWNEEDGSLWCVRVSQHLIKPWAPEKQGVFLMSADNDRAKPIPEWCIVVAEKPQKHEMLHQHHWFVIGDKHGEAYRAQYQYNTDVPASLGQFTISREWVHDTMPGQPRLPKQHQSFDAPTTSPPITLFDMARQWWHRVTTTTTNIDAALSPLVQDVWNTVFHLVLLLRYWDRWRALCDAAYMNRVVLPRGGDSISFPVPCPGSVNDNVEVTVMLSLTRLLWDDKGPFAVCGYHCTVNMHALGMMVGAPYTSMLGVCNEPVCLYYVAQDNTDCLKHFRHYRVDEQINMLSSAAWSSAQRGAPHHSLKYMFHASTRWNPLGRLVPHHHQLLRDIDAARNAVLSVPDGKEAQ